MKINEIKAAMVRAGIKQRDIAAELQIKEQSVNRVINGHGINYRVFDLVAQKLGRDPRKMWGARYRKAA